MNQIAHTHTQDHRRDELTESCPYCGHDITHDEFLDIQARIAKEQKEQFEAEFKKREKQLAAKHLEETSKLRKQVAANDDNLKAQLKSQQDKHTQQLQKQSEQARKEEREKLTKKNAATQKELSDKNKILETEKKKQADQIKTLKEETNKRIEEAVVAESEKAKKVSAKTAAKLAKKDAELEAEKKKAAEEKLVQQKEHQKKLDHQRKVLEKDADQKMAKRKADDAQNMHKLTEQVDDLKRKLEQKSNEELGDGAEVELYTDLKKAFPDDVITRVKNGEAGADIKHEVHVDGRFCGKIVYDSKNRNSWRTSYVEQLRKDQLAEEADHAILATRKFPANSKELNEVNNVLLVNPARAAILANVLRESMIRLANLKLSEQGKKDKQEKLYEFITSANCDNLFQRLADEIVNLRDLDVTEKKQQAGIRGKRAKFVAEIEKAILGSLKDELNRILGV